MIDNAIEEVKKSRQLMGSIHANLKSYSDSWVIPKNKKASKLIDCFICTTTTSKGLWLGFKSKAHS